MRTRLFRDPSPGLADLLNWSHLPDDGVLMCKDGSLLAGWYFSGPDLASSTDAERNWLCGRINASLARFGTGGWAIWVDACRLEANAYPPPDASAFPHVIPCLVDEERRQQFQSEGTHYEGEKTLVVQLTPPLRRQSRISDMVFTDDATSTTSPAARILRGFQKALNDIEDAVGDAVRLRRMRTYVVTDEYGRDHLRDEMVNFLHFCLTGDPVQLNLPPAGAYLDCVLASRELWGGVTPRLGDEFICTVAIEGFPAESYPQVLDLLDHQPMASRWSTRMIFLDTHEGLGVLRGYRRKWRQQVRGFWQQVFRTQGGTINEDAALMTAQADNAIAKTQSGLYGTGYYTSVIVLRHTDREELQEAARVFSREIQRVGFGARIETVNTMEAFLGSLPGHPLPNVRRPPLHTDNLADLLPLASVWTGEDTCSCPLYPPGSPPLLYAASNGMIPFRLNLHVSDVGHTLVFGPTGAGKTTLLCTIALQALRYPGMRVWAFDYKRGMEATVRACGGRHYDVLPVGVGSAEQGNTPTLCPLSALDTEQDVVWAEEWLATCFELQTRVPPSNPQREAIHRAVTLMREPNTPRTLSTFHQLVQDPAVRDAVTPYTLNGTLGLMLDAETDGIGDGNFMVFEIEDLMALGEVYAIPVLLYLFRRFERSLAGRPTILSLDEAWLALGHPVFAPKIRTWLKILRSKNALVLLATQSLSDAVRSGLLDVLIESCPTKIFLANDQASVEGTAENPGSKDFYRAFGLNETQIQIIRNAVPKRHYYAVSPEGRRLFDLGLGPITLSFAGVSSKEDLAQVRALQHQHGEDWPFVWLDTRGVDYRPLLQRIAPPARPAAMVARPEMPQVEVADA